MLIRSLAAAALVFVNVLLVMLILLVMSLPPAVAQMGGGLQGLTSAPDRVAHALSTRSAEVLQDITDRLDATHPPRHPLSHDVEFSAWNRIPVGGTVATSAQNQVTLVEIRRRPNVSSGDHSVYAVVRPRLAAPRVTTLFGVRIHVDAGESNLVLYKGESFQVGGATYKVNWVSAEPSEIAVVEYRRRQDVPAALKFALP